MLALYDGVSLVIMDDQQIFNLKFMLYKNSGIVFYVDFFRMIFYNKTSVQHEKYGYSHIRDRKC